MSGATPRCLTIGSSDSSGTAGVLGDIKTFASLGCYGTCSIVGVTAQSLGEVSASEGISPSLITSQILQVKHGIGIDAVKIATTWSDGVLHAIDDALQDIDVPIVFDPVMVSATGANVGKGASSSVRTGLINKASLITPNIREAQALADSTTTNAIELSQLITQMGAKNVVITGGSQPGSTDVYCGEDGIFEFSGRYFPNFVAHGSGCAFSAAVTALLARGASIIDAIRWSKALVEEAIENAWTSIGESTLPRAVNILSSLLTLEPSQLNQQSAHILSRAEMTSWHSAHIPKPA